MTNWKLILQYDGRGYSGWQRQTNGRTLQELVDTTLTRIFGGERIVLHAAGRTDAGVHALGQVCSFRAETAREAYKVRLALNTLFPETVSCVAAEVMDDSFHARFSAVGKTYRYQVLNRPDRSPFWTGRALHIRRPLDWGAIDAAIPHFVGTHDFSAFRGPGCEGRNPVRTIDRIDHRIVDDVHRIELSGGGFLRYQVRIMVGTLVEIGMGRRSADDVPGILASCDRARSGRTALPDGLYLVEVRY